MQDKINAIGKICQTLDRDGATNYTELLQVALEAVDPNIAQRILQPADVGQPSFLAHADVAHWEQVQNHPPAPDQPPDAALQ